MEIRTIDQGRHHKRELLIDDQVASWLWVIDYQMYIGAAQVRMAGIGGVKTRKAYRKKGYMRALFDDTVRYMIERGDDVSMLFGIPNFYTKFGYAVCLPVYRQVVQTRDAEAAGQLSCHTTTGLQTADMGAVCDLYNAHNAGRTCALHRFPQDFTRFAKGTRWGHPAEAMAIKDPAGKLLAYAAFDRDERAVNVVEVAAVDDRLFPTLLYAFAGQAIARRCGEITLYHPPDHPFAEFVQRFGCRWEVDCRRFGGGMMRILNLGTLFERVQPELARRSEASPLRGEADLSIVTGLGAVTLHVARGRVEVGPMGRTPEPLAIELSQDKLIQLMVGYRRARDVLNEDGVKVTGNILPWLDMLFPRGHPYVWLADHF